MFTVRVAVVVAAAAAVAASAQRQDAFGGSRDHPAIAYSTAPVATPVNDLNRRFADGTLRLTRAPETGYLRGLLDALALPVESQVLVYSGTSLQARSISKRSPRAIYFNDAVALGYVRGTGLLELAAQDPKQGTIYYTLDQQAAGPPQFTRTHQCLSCHLSWDTRAVPGPILQSVFPRKSDRDYASGHIVDHRLDLAERWGGWYVTGRDVPSRHHGNQELIQPGPPPATAPRLDTVKAVIDDPSAYLTSFSDIVALLVLEHQSHATNLMTRAAWESRVGERARMHTAVDELVDYLLFVDEAPLPQPIAGSSGFAEVFTARGPKDAKGRSLRDFDLKTRMMRYPLSYLIYSAQFDAMPADARERAWDRLHAVLSGRDTAPKYGHLSAADRRAIVEILRETKPDLPQQAALRAAGRGATRQRQASASPPQAAPSRGR
jgi:hypothetical protein